MKHSRTLLATLLASSLFIACDDDNDDKIVIEPAPPTPTLQEPTLTAPVVEMTLAGNTFATPCQLYTFQDLDSLMRRVTFDTAGGYSTSEEIFLGDTCGSFPYITIETSGTYVDAGKQSPDQAVINIDFTQTISYITLGTEQIQTTFNANSYCGKSDWKIGERVSLADVTCDFITNNNGATVVDIYAFEESSLYFGSNFSVTAKAGTARPTSVDRTVKFGNESLEKL